MIVTDSLTRIDNILSNMKAAHSRILSSFRIQSSRAIRQDSRISIVYNDIENNKSFKNSKDSTLAQSKQPIDKQQDRLDPDFSERQALNQIVEESMDQKQSHQPNPLRYFKSNAWQITNSRNQQKSTHDYLHVQCASFRDIQEVE